MKQSGFRENGIPKLISKSGYGCITDRPSNYISSDGTVKSGLNIDGDCNDNAGENLSNEPTHILYNNDVAKLDRLRNGKKCLTYDDTKKVLNTVNIKSNLLNQNKLFATLVIKA